jgi:hypothetical protein
VFTRYSVALLLVLLGAGCKKPPPPLVVTLQSDSPDGSQVRHTIISLRSGATKVVLNMQILNPAEIPSYRATLMRGTQKITSADGLKMAPDDTVRLDEDADVFSAGSYSMVLEGSDAGGKYVPVATYNFQVIK